MKLLILVSLFFLSQQQLHAQNVPTITLDGLPSGSVYTDSSGIFTSSDPNCGVAQYTLYNAASEEVILHGPNGDDRAISKAIRKLPSGTKVVILFTLYCNGRAAMKMSIEYFAP